ncbi:hypothetical protein Pmani_007531 [Petrolisthes manimaculis]|uniref:G-protein coupled receptors family 1 profile domain-containing protein n=1 Tax=Petrolisthes manimaculis TaxID=1843537 RepID=A0AAE1QAQ5_9EUCA|nr:hypothetical protein Pmani_007531 [Petrolisthes manimaculis]
MRVTAYWCVRDLDRLQLWQGYETYMLVLVLLVPASIMAIAYTAICVAIVSTVAQRRAITGKGQMMGLGGPQLGTAPPPPDIHQDKTIRQVVPMLVVVVVLFIVCWAPILVLNVMLSYDVVPLVDQRTKHVRTALDLLSYFNRSDLPFPASHYPSPQASLPVYTLTASPLSASPLFASPLTASPLSASPLSASPLPASPLTASPLSASPLTASPLPTSPLSTSPLTASSLSASPLSASPLSASPLSTSPLSASPHSGIGNVEYQ